MDLGAFQKIAPLRGLPDGHQNIAAGNGDRLFLVIDRGKAMLLVVDRYALLEYDRGDFAVFREHFLRAPSVHDGNAFFFHLCDLVLGRGHFAAGLQAEHCDFAVCHTKRCAGYVRRDIAAANYDDVAA